ncbi:hypothetical protein KP509_39G055400 [Ceratopteris richardii]|uniref:Citrate transporter-like domain-containing protein n=1 Tax=Ceratopteris richardii TaxID=49495 RepID=A0A8T2Q0Y8_CERRI|nr:hypothetical protein KP509_39G055400 [Ceratopteris richardii]
MELADTKIVVLGTFAFLVFWVTATFPKFFGLPIGRTAGALVGATLIVIFQVDSPEEAYASINLPILGLLFGTMVVSVYLQRADMFKYLAYILSYRCRGGKDLLCRLSFLVAFSSALFTNDTCCVLFTEFILAFCKEKGLPPEPFLLALSTSANIGSSATPIGNPQNLVIAIESKISFGRFLVGVVPAMVIGITLNLSLLLAMYWKPLSTIVIRKSELKTVNLSEIKSATETENDQSHNDIVGNGDLQKCHSMDVSNDGKSNSLSKCAATHEMSVDRHLETTIFVSEDCTIRTIDSMTSEGEFVGNPNVDILEPKQDGASLVANRSCEMCAQCFLLGWNDPSWKVWKNRFWKLSVYLVTIGMLAALLAGLDLSWCTITAAIALIVLDFEDAGPSLNKVEILRDFF